MNKNQILGLIIATVLFIITGVISVVTNTWSEEKAQAARTSLIEELEALDKLWGGAVDLPLEEYIAVIKVNGSIVGLQESVGLLSGDIAYNHSFTLDYINEITADYNNQGILLVVDSPGGSVYTSDELYCALMDYKEATGRPIYCYFGSYACSGGYYVAMAADEIYANRNTWTGSIGVIATMYDLTGLYNKLGVKEINVTSGANKAMGSTGESLSEEQYSIMQGLIDEAYKQFVGIVAEGRKMPIDEVKRIADGRILSATQAQALDLIEGIARYEEYKYLISNDFQEPITFYEPEYGGSLLSSFFMKLQALMPKSETELFTDLAKSLEGGVWYYADQLK